MVKGDVSPTGMYIWYVDADGKGHNIPVQGDNYGNLLLSNKISNLNIDIGTIEVETGTDPVTMDDLTIPSKINKRYAVFVENESSDIDVDVQFNNLMDTKSFLLGDPVIIPKSSNIVLLIEGLFTGDGSSITFTPKTSVSTAFNMNVAIFEG